MNRSEAKEFDTFSYNGDMDYIKESSVSQRIDAIFDYFEDRSCESCAKVNKCVILNHIYKYRLKNEGYAMNTNEFECRFWDSIF